MDSLGPETNISIDLLSRESKSDLARARVFFLWCLQREAFSIWSYIVLILPALLASFFSWIFLQDPPHHGSSLLRVVLWVAAISIFVGAWLHASSAVCWEVSREYRDLVMLTGIGPRTLLWCDSLSRWWTIGLSISLLLPFAMLVRTLGPIKFQQWFAGGCWLLLLFALMGSFAMFASVWSSNASNPESTAANSTLSLTVAYHIAFFVGVATISAQSWLANGSFEPPPGSLSDRSIELVVECAPVVGLYDGFMFPWEFSVLDPSYWLHFLTAGLLVWISSILMHHRFRVTTQGDQSPTELSLASDKSAICSRHRARCSDRPFFWKEIEFPPNSREIASWWTASSLLAVFLVLIVAAFGFRFALAMICVASVPMMIATRFETLLSHEFREGTWQVLILLPVDPKQILLEKLRAAVWSKRAEFIPVGIAIAVAIPSHLISVLMAVAIALCASVLLVEFSILGYILPDLGLFTFSIVCFVSFLCVVQLWIDASQSISFAVTTPLLLLECSCAYWLIDRRLRNWSEK